ncbi:hypothetical protein, partial [Prochlorothrix hollandica]|uniref:hypothetical protein n=1 Tax=Prochlorothrix hollandica TaxID=1223 RepID=UPI003342BB0B
MAYKDAQRKIAQAKAEGWTELDLAGLELKALPPELWALEQLEVLVLGRLSEAAEKDFGQALQGFSLADRMAAQEIRMGQRGIETVLGNYRLKEIFAINCLTELP